MIFHFGHNGVQWYDNGVQWCTVVYAIMTKVKKYK